MKLSQLGEFALIDLLAKSLPTSKRVVAGVGDDSAVLQIQNSKGKAQKYLLVTTDALVEGVHFRTKGLNFKSLGQKALLANISDIAAMGGLPTAAVVTIGLPKDLAVNKVRAFYAGLKSMARRHQIDLVGGDTVSSPNIFISITLLGEVEKENLLLRSTARVGDLICVTGEFGGPAQAGYDSCSLKVKSRIKEASFLATKQLAKAMIDSSDGLVRSVVELCKASKVGARIFEALVPKAKGVSLSQALYGGEEYELVFTVKPNKLKKIKLGRTRVSVVGEIVPAGRKVTLVNLNGGINLLKSQGYEHFHDK